MKYFLTVAMICVVSVASAQIVNIPDPVFKQVLVDPVNYIDTNGDGEIQVSEALAKTTLNLMGTTLINDFTGIKAFSNLQSISLVWGSNATSFDVSNMTNLVNLNLGGNYSLTSLNVSGCINLEGLNCFEGTGSLNLIMGPLPKLKGLGLAFLAINNLDLRSYDSLSVLDLDNSYVGNLNISGLTKIEHVDGFSSIATFIAAGCTRLKTIKSGMLSQGLGYLLDVTGCVNLETIFIAESNLVTLDLSTCINLQSFTIGSISTPGLGYLNIKNGSFTTVSIHGNGNSTLNICADDFEIAAVTNMIAANSIAPLNISSYCSFFPGGNYNTISGKVRVDLNNNGCDVTDAGMGHVPIRINDNLGGSVLRYTAPTGDYAHYPYAGNFTLIPYFPYQYFNIAPTSANVIFNTANSLVNTTDFCITPTGVFNDLEISFLPNWPPARAGMPAGYQLLYKNRGTTTLSGNVQLNFDNSRMNLTYASTPVSTQTTGQLVWNYNNLAPFESKTIDINFTLLPPPINNIGDTLYYFAVVNPVINDQTPYDNSFILPQRVIGSFDPNDKQCLEGSRLDITSIDKFLHYIIHFQNIGNDTAFNVVVADQLSNKLDWNSVEIIGSSHGCDVSQKNGKLEFFFQNIKLPYKTINEPASNGFVAFKIKPKSSVIVGDSLNNKASIYFDFNSPVITNIATTIVSLIAPIPVKLEYFSGSKQNEKNQLTWKAFSTNGSTNFSIEKSGDGIHFSSISNIIATTERCLLPFSFIDNDPLAGKNYYRLKITDADGVFFYSKVILIQNNKQGFEITAIMSDQHNTSLYLNSSIQQTVLMKLVAADGRLISSQSKTITVGRSQVNLSIKNMADGIYNLVVYTNNGEVITRKFVK